MLRLENFDGHFLATVYTFKSDLIKNNQLLKRELIYAIISANI